MQTNGRNGHTMSNKTMDVLKEEMVDGDMFDNEVVKTATLSALGIAIPINLNHPNGRLRCYITLPAEFASKKEVLFAAIKTLVDKGYPLDFYKTKEGDGKSF